jgi:hypothetical protein
MNKQILVGLLLGLILMGCAKKHKQEGYRIVSYDSSDHHWVISRNGTFDGNYMVKHLIVECVMYQWGKREPVRNSEACHLQVGQLIVPNPIPDPKKPDEFVDVFEMPNSMLSITEGMGSNRQMQIFKIVKYEVLPD